MNIKKAQILANSSPAKEQETPNYTEIKTMSSMIHLKSNAFCPPNPRKSPTKKKNQNAQPARFPYPGELGKGHAIEAEPKSAGGAAGGRKDGGLLGGGLPPDRGAAERALRRMARRRGKRLKLWAARLVHVFWIIATAKHPCSQILGIGLGSNLVLFNFILFYFIL